MSASDPRTQRLDQVKNSVALILPLTVEGMVKRMNEWADRLVPVGGELMRRACGDRDEHRVACQCSICLALLTVHDIQNQIEEITRASK